MDDYSGFLANAIAIERACEANSWERLGALGVAADPYRHQIQNVLAILDAPDIRHLIADEVGLGKTIQALMILNVLVRQDPSLRVAIVAPERISYQWQVELSVRGHRSSEIWNEDTEFERPDGTGYVHIIKSDLVRPTPIVPDPANYDMLIVDEPHILTLSQARFLAALCRDGRNGAWFRHVLLLTATPRFGNSDWARAVFGMIEPDRSNLSTLLGKEMDDLLKVLAGDFFELVSRNELTPDAAVWATDRNRRVLRQTRGEWPETAPKRRIQTVVSKPTDAEKTRLKLVSQRLSLERETDDLQIEGAPWQPVRQLFWSRETVRGALRHGTFSKFSHDVQDCVSEFSKDPGDTQFEDLCDTLLSIWENDPDKPVIIVAGDTPTVDSLEKRLFRMFPELEEDSLIATMRGRQNTSVVDVVGAVHSGARVLILEEWVEAGLNLHHFADDLIFYNLPWNVGRVDQLIGRLDRLRPGGFKRSLAGRSVGDITIWRMVIETSPDHRVLLAMDRLGLFEAPLPYLDDTTISRLDSIVARAAGGFSAKGDNAESLWDGFSFGLEQSRSVLHADGIPDVASEDLFERVKAGERKVGKLLDLLSDGGAFEAHRLSTADNEKVRLLKYPRFQRDFPYILGEMDEVNGEILRIRRSNLTDPTKDIRLKTDRVGRRARFFATGDDLHDDLIGQMVGPLSSQSFHVPSRPLGVGFGNGVLSETYAGCTIAVSVLACLPVSQLRGASRRELDDKLWPHGRVVGLRRIDEWLMAGLEADRRWLQLRFDASFSVEATVIEDGGSTRTLGVPEISELLEGRGTPRAVNSLSPRLPKCERASAIFAEHLHSFRVSEKTRMAGKRAAVLRDLEARSAVLSADTEIYVKASTLAGERLIQQKAVSASPEQRQMLDGQVAAERRRADARKQAADIRKSFLTQDIISLSESFSPVVARGLFRILPPD